MASSYDIVVIGGGITGVGIARDAALRGLSVALFEKADYASGTSSKSSKLIHGGLRYLEHGEIGLVFEAATLAGVGLFAPEASTLAPLIERVADKIALLPHSIRRSTEAVKDDF